MSRPQIQHFFHMKMFENFTFFKNAFFVNATKHEKRECAFPPILEKLHFFVRFPNMTMFTTIKGHTYCVLNIFTMDIITSTIYCNFL